MQREAEFLRESFKDMKLEEARKTIESICGYDELQLSDNNFEEDLGVFTFN